MVGVFAVGREIGGSEGGEGSRLKQVREKAVFTEGGITKVVSLGD